MKIIATATFGLESVVRRELAALGYESAAERPGWLGFRADALAVARTNLWLRASDRVLVEIGAFHATDFDALFEGTRALPWEEWLPDSARFPVRGRSVKSQLAGVPACQSIVKKAIVERLREKLHVSELREDGASFPVEVALLEDEARLLLDTSGAGLHKRGYRQLGGDAPLKETLAAGLVLLTVWNREKPFLDPFCGSGTLPIEAALIGRNRAPGAARSFAAESWAAVPASAWELARDEARALERPPLLPPVVGSDVDAGALASARASAERAGLGSDVRFERRVFEEVAPFAEDGCLVTNPPYGERLGEAGEVRELYRAMPRVFRRFSTWSIYVLTARRDFEELLGQRASRRRKLFNGPLECTFYQFFGPRPGRPGDRPAFGGLTEAARRQAELFSNRLKKRARHLRKWPLRLETDLYRLYEGDIKEVPLVVDRYGDYLRVAPLPFRVTSRTAAEQEDWLELMASTAAATLDVPESRVVLAGRKGRTELSRVREAGRTFEVPLSGQRAPGLEPGGRELRRLLRQGAAERTVLVASDDDGASAVAAAAGGARSVTLLASSERASSRARRGFALNALPLERHRIVVSELLAFLEQDAATYDLALLRLEEREELAGALARLRPRLTRSGVVLAAVPYARARLDPGIFEGWKSEELTERVKPEELRKPPQSAFRLRKVESRT